MRDLTGSLIRAGRAAVGCQRNGQGVHAAVGHGLKLLAQRQRLRPGLPGVQDLVLSAGLGHAGQPVHDEIHAGRQDQAVVGQFAAAGQAHGAFVGVDAGDPVADHRHAVALAQVVIGCGDVGHGLAATQHQVGDGAGDKGSIGLDQGHVNLLVRPHPHIFCGGRAAVAPAHHHHFGPALWPGGRKSGANTGNAEERAVSGSLDQLTTMHAVPLCC